MKKKSTPKRTAATRYGKGKVQINATIPQDIDDELRRQAASAGVTRSAYASLLIIDGITDPVTITRQRLSGKVIAYPMQHPQNPTARAAENPPA
jgi:hypothetical protein